MKVFFAGAIQGHRPGTGMTPSEEDSDLLRAGVDLGYEAAKAGHVILVRNVASLNVVDSHILKGVIKYCKENPERQASVELDVPEFYPLKLDAIPPSVQIITFRHPGHGPLTEDDYYSKFYFRYLTALVSAIDRCDIAITMGDGETVKMVGNLGVLGKAPVVAIASFGGSSRAVFERNRNLYVNMVRDISAYSVLTEDWGPDSARRVLALGEHLYSFRRGREGHSYFISYAHHDVEVADHIELLLRRKHRLILRDETGIAPGERLSDLIAAMIMKCDIFLAIGSRHYVASPWCRRELAYAIERLGRDRVVYLEVDGSDYPIEVADSVRCAGSTREQRQNTVEFMISKETVLAEGA